jgi:pSer/pThr/pTyr-binding forkhead associated (FHA) protein
MHHDIELHDGEFAIGRSASCQLSLDDPLVSRRHATFKIFRGKIEIEDLGSRNGILLNGQRIESGATVTVRPGDKILIGSQELTVIEVPDDQRALRMTALRDRDEEARQTQSGGPLLDLGGGREEHHVTKVSTWAVEPEQSFVKRIDGFRVLGSVAEKALAMGRADEAERVLATSLADVLEASRSGKAVPLPLAEQATRFAAKLASATGKGTWVDYAIEVYATLQRPAPAIVIDELYGAFRKVTAVDVGKVKAYVEALRGQLATFGPADRFLFQRIEGLERLATLRP